MKGIVLKILKNNYKFIKRINQNNNIFYTKKIKYIIVVNILYMKIIHLIIIIQ